MGRLDTIPLLTSKKLSSQECLPNFKNEKYVVSYLSRAWPLSIVLEFLSIGNELNLLTLEGPICFLLQKHYLKNHVKENFCIFSPFFFF